MAIAIAFYWVCSSAILYILPLQCSMSIKMTIFRAQNARTHISPARNRFLVTVIKHKTMCLKCLHWHNHWQKTHIHAASLDEIIKCRDNFLKKINKLNNDWLWLNVYLKWHKKCSRLKVNKSTNETERIVSIGLSSYSLKLIYHSVNNVKTDSHIKMKTIVRHSTIDTSVWNSSSAKNKQTILFVDNARYHIA